MTSLPAKSGSRQVRVEFYFKRRLWEGASGLQDKKLRESEDGVAGVSSLPEGAPGKGRYKNCRCSWVPLWRKVRLFKAGCLF